MIEATDLTKRYGGRTAVDRVSFTCRPGTVTGFLGPNGAGKSTTMRMICGLTPPAAGSATIGGAPYRRLGNPGRHVGVLLDASAQHAGRSGREALRLSARVIGVGDRRVDEVLAQVDLTAAARRRIGGYSLGMRQRLGLAHALLGDPPALILDEPANGLDPAGIHWIRGLLRDFADRGGTVLLSSHLLREVEAVADDLLVIGAGRIVARGSREELLASTGTRVRARDLPRLRAALHAADLPVRDVDADALVVSANPERVGEIAAGAGLVLRELCPADGGGLEQIFLDLTTNAAKEPAR